VADFQTAITWTLTNWEDPKGTYEKGPDAPPGAFAIAGVNSAAWPNDFAAIDASELPQRATLVENFYLNHFWNQWLNEINSDEVAKRVFDAGVNMGSGTAVKLFQAAINASSQANITVDGGLGPNTIAAANGCDEEALVEQFKAVRSQHYNNIVANNPADEKYLNGWLSRAQA
jgi:lysozyme family protein